MTENSAKRGCFNSPEDELRTSHRLIMWTTLVRSSWPSWAIGVFYAVPLSIPYLIATMRFTLLAVHRDDRMALYWGHLFLGPMAVLPGILFAPLSILLASRKTSLIGAIVIIFVSTLTLSWFALFATMTVVGWNNIGVAIIKLIPYPSDGMLLLFYVVMMSWTPIPRS